MLAKTTVTAHSLLNIILFVLSNISWGDFKVNYSVVKTLPGDPREMFLFLFFNATTPIIELLWWQYFFIDKLTSLIHPTNLVPRFLSYLSRLPPHLWGRCDFWLIMLIEKRSQPNRAIEIESVHNVLWRLFQALLSSDGWFCDSANFSSSCCVA